MLADLTASSVAQEMLLDEEEVKKSRDALGHQTEPRERQQERQRHGEWPDRPSPASSIALDQRGRGEDAHREKDRDDTLDEHPCCHRKAGNHLPAAPAVVPGTVERHGRQGHAQGDRYVEDRQPAKEEEERRRREHDGRRPARGIAEAIHPEPCGHANGQHGGKRRNQPRAELVHADHPIAEGGEPVDERRLLCINEPIQPRHDPVVGGEHLARNLGVATLVGFEERRAAEPLKVEERGREQHGSRQRNRRVTWAGNDVAT